MKFTGEFFIPPDSDSNFSNHELQVEHKHRYLSIAPLCKGKVVLDIASGEGYGSNWLASVASQVYGVDINPELTAHASQKYKHSHLSFINGSVEQIPLPDKSVDVVISFETIEHISADMQRRFLGEVNRVLKDGGIFAVSTPNKKNYTDRYDYHNEFHIHELYKEEFDGLLKEYFAYVNLFDQGFEVTSLILNEETYKTGTSIAEFHIDENAYLFEGKYLIAVCSNDGSVMQHSIAGVIPESPKSFLQLTDTIIRVQNEIEELGAWGRRSNEELDEARSRYTALHDEYEQLNRLNQQQRDELERAAEQLEALQKQYNALLTQHDALVAQHDALVPQQNALQREQEKHSVNIQHYQKSNYELKVQLKKKNDELDNLMAAKRELESHRIYKLEAEKKELESRLQDIYSSDGYRLLSIYYKTKDKIIPENSGRQKKLKAVKQFLKNKTFLSRIRGKKPPPVAVSDSQLARDYNIIPDVPTGTVFPIVFPVIEQPVVSIVIPAYNNWAFTRNCLVSIYQLTDDVTYEVIVGDNVSTDETVNLEKYFTNVVYLRNKENLGYIRNVNNAASHARGKYILTLNNDTTVTKGWLSHLVDVMERDATVGLVGSKLVYPNGSLQEAGGIIWKDASGWNYGREGNPDAPEYNYLKDIDYVSGASNLIRKEIWTQLKGLDERYVPAYFDDSDLAFSIRRLGFRTVYQPLSVVIHYEGMAHGTDTSTGTKKYQVVNKEKFIDKWRAVLQKEHFPNGQEVFYARDKSKGKKTIVVVDHYVPQFDKDAGSRTTYQLLKLFVRLGYNVKFIGDNFYKHEPYTTMLQQMGIEVLYGEYYRDHWKDWVLQNKEYIDFFYINRPHISIKYIDFLKEHTQSRIVYYGHDLHYVRERVQYEIEKDPALLTSIEEWKQTETKLIKSSDTILTLSWDEKEIIEKEIGHSNVRIMPAFSYAYFNEPVTNFGERHNILFVGGFGHKPNVDAVIWFAKEVFPLISRQLKDVQFIVAGSKPPKEVTQLASSKIDVKGYVSDEELELLYKSSRIVVIPLRYGAGVKGKTVEAMHQGVPFVTTRFGIEGLQDIREVTTAKDTAEEFAEEVVSMYRDDKRLEEFSRKAVAYAQKYFSEDNTTAVISAAFS